MATANAPLQRDPHWEVTDPGGGVRVLTLHHEQKRNALTDALLGQLSSILELKDMAAVRVLVLRGAAGTFCSGYDLSSLAALAPDGRLPDALLGETLARLEQFPAPTLALVEGAAFGAGCELATTCDFRVCAEGAVFCMPPARLGVVYAPAGLQRLMALVGMARAKRMVLTARRVPAVEALLWGLADEVAAGKDVERTAFTLAVELAQGAPLAVQGMKRSLNVLARGVLPSAVEAELAALRARAFASSDLAEGRAAFLAKRVPKFTGR